MKSNTNDNEFSLPEIIFFESSASAVQNKEKFLLSWEVKNANLIEIYKNGISFLKRNADATNVTISENYDGKDKEIEYRMTASNDVGQMQSMPVFVTVTEIVEKQDTSPKIISFESSTATARNKEPFTLSWEVENAAGLELLRNGIVFRKLGTEKKSATFSESYDGVDRDIVYTLVALKDGEKTESGPLTVTIKEKAPIKTEVTKESKAAVADEMTPIYQMRYQDTRQKNLRKIRIYLWALLLTVIFALIAVIYYFQSKPKIFDFDPKSIAEEHSIVIVGKNFPKDTTKFQVIFNKIKGSIQYSTQEIIRVIVPQLAEQIGDGNIAVALVYKGDTIHASKNLTVIKKIAKNEIVAPVNNDITPPATDSQVAEVTKKTIKVITPPKKIRVDSTPVKVDSQPVVKREEPKKHVEVDIFKLVKVSSNDFKKGFLGGVKNLKVTVQNDSPYDLDNVTITISYQKKNEREIKKDQVNIPNIRAHSSSTQDIPNTSRGSKVNCTITAINSKQLDADLKR